MFLVQLGLSLIPVLVVIYCHLTFTKKIILRYLSKTVKTIDKRVCLEVYNKSEIKQLGTCRLTVGHGKNAKLCHFYIVPDYCRPILGLNDVQSLSLVAIKCDVTDKWSVTALGQWALHPLLMQWRSNQVLFCQKSESLMVGSRESSRVWDISQ